MNKLKEVIALTFAYYNHGRAPADAVLKLYAEDLADLDPAKCIDAYNRFRRNPANRVFPLPAQIRQLVNPDEFVAVEAQAREIAARICGAVSKFGWCNQKKAKVFIGPVGWSVVERQGGWSYLCENLGRSIQPTSFQAQLRDQLEGTLRHGVEVIERKIGVTADRVGELEKPENVLNLVGKLSE